MKTSSPNHTVLVNSYEDYMNFLHDNQEFDPRKSEYTKYLEWLDDHQKFKSYTEYSDSLKKQEQKRKVRLHLIVAVIAVVLLGVVGYTGIFGLDEFRSWEAALTYSGMAVIIFFLMWLNQAFGFFDEPLFDFSNFSLFEIEITFRH